MMFLLLLRLRRRWSPRYLVEQDDYDLHRAVAEKDVEIANLELKSVNLELKIVNLKQILFEKGRDNRKILLKEGLETFQK